MPVITLPAGNHSPEAARAFVRVWLTSWGLDDLQDRVELATSELVTNAVVHVNQPLALELDADSDAGRVILAVGDRLDRRPRLGNPSNGSDHGRGLHIVDSVSDEWGSDALDDGGKVVWCAFSTAPTGPIRL